MSLFCTVTPATSHCLDPVDGSLPALHIKTAISYYSFLQICLCFVEFHGDRERRANGWRPALRLGHCSILTLTPTLTLTLVLLSHPCAASALFPGSLSCCPQFPCRISPCFAAFILPCTFTVVPGTAAEKLSCSVMLMPPGVTVGTLRSRYLIQNIVFGFMTKELDFNLIGQQNLLPLDFRFSHMPSGIF